MNTFLLFLPLIIVTIFMIFGGVLIIDDIVRQEKKSKLKH